MERKQHWIRLSLGLLFNMFFFSAISQAAAIKDAESNKHAEDASRYRVVDTYEFAGFKLIQFELPTLSIYSYILSSEGEALVVDPARDISVFLDTAKKEGVRITGVYLSHSHADFVAGHIEMKNAVNCPIYQSLKSGVNYPIEALKEGSAIRVGKATVKFIETPGHTPDGMCGLVYGPGNRDLPELVFTGDVLFVGSVGRPDLLGETVSAAWLASAFYDAWTTRIAKLSDTVRVFPAHGAGSLCGAYLSDRPYSTIGEEKKSNPYLKLKSRSEFIASLIQDLPEAPQYFKYNAAMNKKGPHLVDWDRGLPPEKKPDSSLTEPGKTYVVDIREPNVYEAEHIPKSVNIPLRGRFETWVGTMVPWGADLVLVGDRDELKEALFRLHRIGYNPEIITLDNWKSKGGSIKAGNPITPEELYRMMQDGTAPLIVDVRLPSEWMALRIGTVLNLPLSQLAELSKKLDPDAPVVVVCNSAYRSSMAAGILERKGFKNPRNLKGGSQAWIDAGLPVYEAPAPVSAKSAAPTGKAVPTRKPLKPMISDEGC